MLKMESMPRHMDAVLRNQCYYTKYDFFNSSGIHVKHFYCVQKRNITKEDLRSENIASFKNICNSEEMLLE